MSKLGLKYKLNTLLLKFILNILADVHCTYSSELSVIEAAVLLPMP